MTPERWRRVSDLYEAVLDRPAGARDAFLAEVCAGDSALRRDVLSLLAQDDRRSPLDLPVWVPDDLLADGYNAGFPQPMRLAPGTRLGPYEIQSAIGAGGMGEVYRGRDTRLDRPVAIKVLKPEVGSDPAFRARFDREARTISQLDHPSICPLFDVGEQDGTAYLVMPLLEGEPLVDRLRRGPLPLPTVLRIASGLASALTYAHGRGVLHRDIKPHNMLMLADGRTMLLDFGIAKPYGLETDDTAAETSAALTRVGQTLGTLEYMAPEQLAGRMVDGRSDMFSLGIVLAELVTGTHPFRGATPAVTASAILDRPFQGLPDTSGSAGALDAIVRRMLAREPADRFPSMADCLAELRLLEHDSGASLLVGRGAGFGGVGHTLRRRGAVLAAAAVLAVSAAALIVWRGRSETPSTTPVREVAATAPAATSAPQVPRLTFWLEVKPNADAPPSAVFRSLGDDVYPRESSIRLNLVAPPATRLYVVADETPSVANPTGLTLLFPRAGARQAGGGDPVVTDWMAFTGPAPSDRVWLIASTTPLDDLDALGSTLRASDHGLVTNADAARRIRAMLDDTALHGRVLRDTPNARALTGASQVVHRLELRHE